MKIQKFCKYCGKQLNKNYKTFCDNKCQQNYQYCQYIDNWKNGLEDGMAGSLGVSKHIRRYLLEKYNYSCHKCGWNTKNPFTNKVVLEIEHIDGNYRNNNENNLDLLCPNCHSLTPTYKALNRGHGRTERK